MDAGPRNEFAQRPDRASDGAERYWIGDVVQRDPSFRNREAEFQVKGLDATTLKQRLADLDAYEVAALGKLRLRDPGRGTRVTARWAARSLWAGLLLHPLQHTGQHVGHIEAPGAAVEAEGERTGEEP